MAAINPITSERLKTFVLLGHSNADGWAEYRNMMSKYPEYRPGASPLFVPDFLIGIGDLYSNFEDAYWKNIYVATSAQPFPEPYGTPNLSTPGQVDWLEMTVANPMTPGGPHPHASPFDYANVRGSCYPRWLYNAYPSIHYQFASGNGYGQAGALAFPSSPNDSPSSNWWNQQAVGGTLVGLEIPFAWIWRNFWQEQVGVVKVAFSSSLFMPLEENDGSDLWVWGVGRPSAYYTPSFTPGYIRSSARGDAGYYCYWDLDEFDWSPTTDRLYRLWLRKMAGAAAALPAGTKIDVQCVVAWFGDNDADRFSQNAIQQGWENSVRAFVKRVRQDLVDNDWTTLSREQIPIIWPKIHSGYPGPNDSPGYSNYAFMNGVLETIASEDAFFSTIDVEDLSLLDDSGDAAWENLLSRTTNHFGSDGYVTAANRIFSEWEAMRDEAFDALDLDEAMTLKDVIDRVRTYYTRGRSQTDVDRDTLVQHINAAMYHVLNHCGDNCWWLRYRELGTLTVDSNYTVTLPKYMHRPLRIVTESDPDYPIQFEQIGHTQGGRMQILLKERLTGDYVIEYIRMPKEMTRDQQILPAPRNVAEWIVVETCARLARASTNMVLRADLLAESMRLQQDTLRSLGQTQRTKRDRLRTQRRFPNMRYHRYGGSGWGKDY